MKKLCKRDKKKSEQKSCYKFTCKCGLSSNNCNKLCKPKAI